jgi:hypothetical protein
MNFDTFTLLDMNGQEGCTRLIYTKVLPSRLPPPVVRRIHRANLANESEMAQTGRSQHYRQRAILELPDLIFVLRVLMEHAIAPTSEVHEPYRMLRGGSNSSFQCEKLAFDCVML